MQPSQDLDFFKIFDICYRRKGLIIAVFVAVFSLTLYLAKSLPNLYRSSTLILITPQSLPASYVSSTVTASIEQRINTIAQHILSRTNLEKIIDEFNLFPATGADITKEDRVLQLRKKIIIDTRRNDTFQLSFDAEGPEKAMQITARLASLFIEENLKVREQQAAGTTTFIHAEADRLRRELENQETQVNEYRAKYGFELPAQLDANLRMLEQLGRELENHTRVLASLQERKGILEKQIVEAEMFSPELGMIPGLEGAQITPRGGLIESRKKELDILLNQYTARHPDVIRLKREIQTLQADVQRQESEAKKSPSPRAGSGTNSLKETLLGQIADLEQEINALKSKNETLRAERGLYQARVNNTPLRGIDLSKISRNYEITLKKYQDLLAKGLDSELSENMEKRQKGEQFQVRDPANLPEKPVRPDRPRILVVGLLLGLGAGVALAVLLETLDTSFKRSDDLDGYVTAPVLATIPAFITRGSILEQRRKQGFLVAVSVVTIAVGIGAIRLYVQLLAGFF